MAVTQSATDVIRFGAAADAVTGLKLVQKFVWVGPTTAGHKLIITDTAGVVFLEWQACVADAGGTIDIDYHQKSARMEGIIVTTMGSGKVDVYLE